MAEIPRTRERREVGDYIDRETPGIGSRNIRGADGAVISVTVDESRASRGCLLKNHDGGITARPPLCNRF